VEVWERVGRAGWCGLTLEGSRTTRQCSSMWVRPAGGSLGGFGVSSVSAMAGVAGCQERSRWACPELWGRTHLCTAFEDLGAGWDPWVSCTVCLGVVWGGWGEVGGSGEVMAKGCTGSWVWAGCALTFGGTHLITVCLHALHGCILDAPGPFHSLG